MDLKENEIVLDDSLRSMRIKESPMKSDENLLVEDWLEKGFLRLYEYMGGLLYIFSDDVEMNNSDNVAMVAELEVTVSPEKKQVKLDRIFSEYGYDYEDLMKSQLLHFASFYGFSFGLLDLNKRKRCA